MNKIQYGPFLEEWRDVKDYEGFYQISNYGRVKSLARSFIRNGSEWNIKERILKNCVDFYGYCVVCLSKDNIKSRRKVHVLVAMAFHGHVPCGYKLVVNHMFFDRTFNIAPYLEVITQRENANRKHIKTTSKYIGVHWSYSRKKWVSSIHINGRTKGLGRFTDELDAHLAYQSALTEHLKQTA